MYFNNIHVLIYLAVGLVGSIVRAAYWNDK